MQSYWQAVATEASGAQEKLHDDLGGLNMIVIKTMDLKYG